MEFPEKDVVCKVEHVQYSIPAEESAAGFEIPLDGVLRIVKENDKAYVNWSPSELTVADVQSLFSAGSEDTWTIIEDTQIDVSDLTVPDPILGSGSGNSVSEGNTQSNVSDQENEHVSTGENEVTFTAGEKDNVVPPPRPPPPQHENTYRAPPRLLIHFPIERLEWVRENPIPGKSSSLLFHLTNNETVAPLTFQDGGTSTFLSAMQRFTYLVRSGNDLNLLLVEDFSRFAKKPQTSPFQLPRVARDGSKKQMTGDGLISAVEDVVVGFSKVTKFVKSNILQAKPLPEKRPGTEEDEEEREVEAASIICHQSDKPAIGRLDTENSLLTEFQLVDDVRGLLPPLPGTHPRRSPVTREDWEMYRDFDGRISYENESKFRVHVFTGGIEPVLRREVWKYLLGYFSFQETDLERMERRQQKEDEYFCMKKQWQSMTETQIKNFSVYRECSQLITKDVLRTDRETSLYKDGEGVKIKQMEDILRTYLIYNVDLGYVQGMSDLLAPLLAVMDNEIDSFWCFVGYMDMVHKYFEKSQQRTKYRLKVLRLLLSVQEPELYDYLRELGANNMFFAFRWLLVNFKREFTYNDIMQIWEVIWCGVLSTDYALFIALAILGKYKEGIINEQDQSGIIRFVNDLAMGMNADEILSLAEVYCLQLHHVQSLPDDLQPLVVPGGKNLLFANLPVKATAVLSTVCDSTNPS